MSKFISCDWGTTSFRLRLVEANTQSVLAEVKSNQGIAETHSLWKQQSLEEDKRILFYQSVILDHLMKLQKLVTQSLQELPIIISGMASSNIGMCELPYKKLPFSIDGSDLEFKKINASESFQHEIILISGTKTESDVMRGEETQLIGCDFPSDEECIYIFPGTHSKQVRVKDKKVTDFKTYMTGEFFHLLSHQSVLSKSVEENNLTLHGDILKRFEEGVAQSIHGNILNLAFRVRTNHLLSQYSKDENYHYLSGLLIGTELKELVVGITPITIVASELMRNYYLAALKKLSEREIKIYDVDIALVNGHGKVYKTLSA